MKLFGADTNSGMIRKTSDWFGMNFNPKLSSGNGIIDIIIIMETLKKNEILEFYI